MTLLVAFHSPECIVLASDMKLTDAYVHDSTSFKHRWVGLGTLAMFATDDADSCNGILQRVALQHDEGMRAEYLGDPYFYADRIAKTARRVLGATYGGDWEKEAPDTMFVVAGWKLHPTGVSTPVVLRLHLDHRFEPKPLDAPFGVWGSGSAIAKYLLDVIAPDHPLSLGQMGLLSFLLIQESSRKLDQVGNTAFIWIIEPGQNPRPMSMADFKQASKAASQLAWYMGDTVRGGLCLPEREAPDFLT